MKKLYVTTICLLLISCAPILTKNVMQEGVYDFRLSELKQNPDLNRGNLFILGGIIVKTALTKEGSLIEAIYVPVNSMGHLKSPGTSNERFLAIYRGKDILDPVIYHEKREITIAGEFAGTRKGIIGEMEYVYPLFNIKEIYLWEEIKASDYYRYPPYFYPLPHYRYRGYPYYDYPYYPYYPWWY
ncbi:MAG: hypothetical protein C4538_07150 [Nitrospiraceae bacterium]|nr:MAG: hypothetical protein C4538_07150 [Nitrospiraceae bacterium]